MTSKQCLACNVMFYRTEKYKISQHWNKVLFCGNKCSAVYRGQKLRKPDRHSKCSVCSGLYTLNKKYSDKQRADSKYCSLVCQVKARTTRLLKDCIVCKQEFTTKLYDQHTHNHCSYKCAGISLRNGNTSEIERIRKSKQPKWRKQIFDRDDYTCTICNQRGGRLNADHITPLSVLYLLGRVSEAYELSNGRTLCEPCHRKTPTYGRRAQHMIKNTAEGWSREFNA